MRLFDLDRGSNIIGYPQVAADPSHHDELGFLLYSMGRYEEAADELLRALELDHDLPSAHYRLGLVHTRTGRGALAIDAYRHAAELAPERSSVHRALGLELVRLGDKVAARRSLKRAGLDRPGYRGAGPSAQVGRI